MLNRTDNFHDQIIDLINQPAFKLMKYLKSYEIAGPFSFGLIHHGTIIAENLTWLEVNELMTVCKILDE